MNYSDGFSSYFPFNLTVSPLEQASSAQEQQFLPYQPTIGENHDFPFSTSSAFLDDLKDTYSLSPAPSGVYVNSFGEDLQGIW